MMQTNNVVIPSPSDMLVTAMAMHSNNLRTALAGMEYRLKKFKEILSPFHDQEQASTDYLGKRFMDSFLPALYVHCKMHNTLQNEIAELKQKIVSFELWMLITPDERRQVMIRQRAINELADIHSAAWAAQMSVEKTFSDSNTRYNGDVVKFINTRTRAIASRIQALANKQNNQTYQNYIISGEETDTFL